MKDTTLKGLVHVLLAMAAGAEAVDSTTKTRKFLLGTAAGWHASSAFYHFCIEPFEEKQ
jgi:hypothetical protein